MKRVTWFLTGVAAGAAGAGYTKRKVRNTAAQLAPVRVVGRATSRAKERVDRMREAVHEGVEAMRAKEAELRAWRDGRVEPLDVDLEPGDRILIEGRVVEPGQVVVLRDEAARRGITHPRRTSRNSRRRAN